MHACDTTCLSQSASKPHSAHPAGLPQTKQSSSGISGIFFSSFLSEVSHLTCLIALLALDHRAYSPAGISLPHSAHLPLYFTKSLIQSFISSSPSRSPLLSTRRQTRHGSCQQQTRLG